MSTSSRNEQALRKLAKREDNKHCVDCVGSGGMVCACTDPVNPLFLRLARYSNFTIVWYSMKTIALISCAWAFPIPFLQMPQYVCTTLATFVCTNCSTIQCAHVFFVFGKSFRVASNSLLQEGVGAITWSVTEVHCLWWQHAAVN